MYIFWTCLLGFLFSIDDRFWFSYTDIGFPWPVVEITAASWRFLVVLIPFYFRNANVSKQVQSQRVKSFKVTQEYKSGTGNQ